LLVAITQWRRSKAEAAALEVKFGDRYREYRARTWL
jgi:protein-S-isoprenylcysteine O-methyltransferase Ste14